MAESIGSNVAQDTPPTLAVLPVAPRSPDLPAVSPVDPGMAEGTLLAVSGVRSADAITAADEAAMIASNDPFDGIPTLLAQAYAAILGPPVASTHLARKRPRSYLQVRCHSLLRCLCRPASVSPPYSFPPQHMLINTRPTSIRHRSGLFTARRRVVLRRRPCIWHYRCSQTAHARS